MLIQCNNKGCHQQSNALLNPETLEVVCQECGKSINNISESMKRVLKSNGQVLKINEKKAFMMACKSCNANREVVVGDNNNIVCRICKSEVKVHTAMKQAILQIGNKLSVQNEEPEITTEDVVVEDKLKKTRKGKKNQ